MRRSLYLLALAGLALHTLTPSARAQPDSPRLELEITGSPGLALSVASASGERDRFGVAGVELTGDLRLYDPSGVGGVLRLGGLVGHTFGGFVEGGLALRIDPVPDDGRFGLGLSLAVGPSIGYGSISRPEDELPISFHRVDVEGLFFGGFATASVDLQFGGDAIVALGATVRGVGILRLEDGAMLDGLSAAITPMIRAGRRWDL